MIKNTAARRTRQPSRKKLGEYLARAARVRAKVRERMSALERRYLKLQELDFRLRLIEANPTPATISRAQAMAFQSTRHFQPAGGAGA